MGIGLILSLVGAAWASGLPWYVGEPVAQVSLEAAQGVLPADNLEPLLRTQAGESLTVGTLRADVALLVSAGGFASVEATVEPWVIVDEWGMPEDAVKVVYRVIAAPKVESLRIRGVRGAARKVVESGFGVDLGDAWFGDDEAQQLTRTIQARLSQAGWTDATAEVGVEAVEDGIRLTVVVDAGEPQRVGAIRVAGELPVAPTKIRKWLRKNGLKKGRRFDQAKGDLARLDVVDRLRAMGWSRSRVSLFVQDRTVSEALGISVLVSPGPRLVIDGTGRKLPGEKHLREVMGLRAGDRYSDNALNDASSRLESWYADRGYRGAEVDVRVHSSTSETTKVTVDARPGRKHWLRETNYPDEMPIPEREARAVVQEATDGSLAERIVSQKGIERAAKALKERFRSEGFLDAQVSIEETKGGFSGVMSVTRWGVPVTLDVKVEPGSRVSLGSLRVRGGTGLADGIVAAWKAKHVGRPFRSGSVAELESAVLSEYEKNGHLDVRARVSTVRERARGTASVDILVEPGEALQLRSVVIRGNRRTRRQVIQREVMLKSGDAIAPGAVSATRTNLYNLDLFRQVSPELVGDEPNSRDLVLTVAERANILLEAGGGVSTDQGIAATGRATHRNIAGRGHRLTGLGSVGYGWDGDEWLLNTATPVWRAAARYEIPYVPGRGGRLVSEALFNEAVQEPAWRLSRTGGSLGMKMRLSDRSEAVVDYRVQVRRLVDVDPGALVNGDPWVPYLGLADDLSGDPVLTSDARIVSGGGLMVVHDQRDDRFNPRKGGLWSTHVEFGDGAFTGNVTMRASGKIERLIPVGPLVVDLVGRAGVGFAQGRTVTLPLEERFFLGGGSSLRGFATDSVGPANFAMRPEIDHPSQSEPLVDGLALPREPGHWVATGGDAMFSGTVELRVPLSVIGVSSDSASLVLFSDAGKVAFLDPTVVTTSTIEGQDPWARFSFGTGLRIATPVGPASFDVGINPNPISARDEAWILPHLSLGVL